MNTMNTQNSSRKRTWARRILPGVCLGLLSLVSLCASATTYYVDFVSGNDSNNGSDPSTPWQHCPGDASATGNPHTTALGAGDTVIFKGGVAYTNSITINWSGGVGNPITYDGNSAGSFGSGMAIMDGQYTNKYGFYLSQKANLAIQNFQIQHIGGTPPSTYGSYTSNNFPVAGVNYGYAVYGLDVTNLTIANSLIQQIGTWTNQPPVTASAVHGYGVVFYSPQNLIITNCEFTEMFSGIAINGGHPANGLTVSNVVLTGCNIHNYIVWGITSGPAQTNVTISGVTITNCALHDFPEYCAPYWWSGTDPAHAPHIDGIFLGIAMFSNVVFTNITIENNQFYWNYTNGGGSALIYITGFSGNLNLYNNVFLNNYFSFGDICCDAPPPASYNNSPLYVNIMNNTFLNPNVGLYIRNRANYADPLAGTWNIQNNIFAITNAANSVECVNFDFETNLPTVMDHNIYYNKAAGAVVISRTLGSGTIYYSLPQFQTAFGLESNGCQATSLSQVFANPLVGLGFNSSANDVHPNTNFPAITNGNTLISLFQYDKAANPRPTVGSWTVGAYQTVVPVQLLPPSNLHVVP